MTISKTFYAAFVAIVLGTITGVLAAAAGPGGPIEGAWFAAPLVAGITAIATLIRVTFGVEDAGA